MELIYKPQPTETLGQFLKRLRQEAGKLGRPITLDRMATLSADWPLRFTKAWLSKVERDEYQQPDSGMLRTVAGIYSQLLRTTISPEMLLALAGYEVNRPDSDTNAPENEINKLLRDPAILCLVAAGAELKTEDIYLLLKMAGRLIKATDPSRKIGDYFTDPTLSAPVKHFLEAMDI